MTNETSRPSDHRALLRRTIIDIALRRQRSGTGSSTTAIRERSARMQWPDLAVILDPIPWAVIGAAATRSYMPERMTRDLDIAVQETDAAEVAQRLRRAGYIYGGELTIGGSTWTAPDGIPVDVIEVNDGWWPQALTEAASNRDAQGLPVIPLHYLVLSKLLAGRAQDIADVTRMLGQASENELDKVRDLLATYQPDLLDDIESMITLGRMEMEGEGPA